MKENYDARPIWEKEADQEMTCSVCGRTFTSHIHVHEGHPLHLYGGVTCCDTCWNANWDGWAPCWEPRLLQILKEKNLPVPERNEEGWLPRD